MLRNVILNKTLRITRMRCHYARILLQGSKKSNGNDLPDEIINCFPQQMLQHIFIFDEVTEIVDFDVFLRNMTIEQRQT